MYRVGRQLENARKNVTYPPPEVLPLRRTKAAPGRGDFYLGDKKKLFGEFAKSGLRRPTTDHQHDKLCRPRTKPRV